MNELIKKQIAAYRSNFIANSDSPVGVFWNNTTTQHERFNQIIQPLLNYKNFDFSICDIGCGVGDLHHFLTERNINHTYTGIEIVEEMIDKAKQNNNKIDIRNINILEKPLEEKFDFTVLSGTLNMHGGVPEKEWKDFVFNMVSRMFSMSNIGISFNTLTSYSTFRSAELFYLQPEEMLTFIQDKLSRFYVINTAYPLYEVTYTVFRKEALKEKFTHEHFNKYHL